MSNIQEINLHNLQKRILYDLLFESKLKYSELKPLEMENAQFVFHIKQLIDKNLVKKLPDGYQLTDIGKEYANKINVDNIGIYFQSKITAVLCAIQEDTILIYKRLKNPFFGCYGFPTRKVLWGHDIEKSAEQGLHDETGLTGKGKLFSIKHYIVKNSENKIVEDKTMFALIFNNPKGNLEPIATGEYEWVDKSKLKALTPTQPEFSEFLKDLLSTKESNIKDCTFKEYTVRTDLF